MITYAEGWYFVAAVLFGVVAGLSAYRYLMSGRER